jgi:hypothetical protein
MKDSLLKAEKTLDDLIQKITDTAYCNFEDPRELLNAKEEAKKVLIEIKKSLAESV